MKKFILMFMVFAISLFAETYKVGFAQDTLDNDWRKAQADELVNTAKKYPFLSVTVKDANSKVSNQIADLEYFIENNYDFIITSPIDEKITSLVLKKAIKKNIKVILIDRGIISDDYTSFISPDNYKIAKRAGEYLVKKLNCKGTVLILEGIKGASVTKLRRKGFNDAIRSCENIKLITKRANFLRSQAITVTDELLDDGIKFDAIYSHSDSMLSGVRTAYKKRGIKLDKLNVGIDYIHETKEAILNGEQDVSFTYNTCGKEGIEKVVKIINNEKIKKNYTPNSTMVTKENAHIVEPTF